MVKLTEIDESVQSTNIPPLIDISAIEYKDKNLKLKTLFC